MASAGASPRAPMVKSSRSRPGIACAVPRTGAATAAAPITAAKHKWRMHLRVPGGTGGGQAWRYPRPAGPLSFHGPYDIATQAVQLTELLAPDRVRVPLRSRAKDDLLREL